LYVLTGLEQRRRCADNGFLGACRAANAGLYARANACACGSCSAEEFGIKAAWDLPSIKMKELRATCLMLFMPLGSGVVDAALNAGNCATSGISSWEEPPSVAPPPPPAPPAPVPGPPVPVPVALPEGTGSGAGTDEEAEPATVTVPIIESPVSGQ